MMRVPHILLIAIALMASIFADIRFANAGTLSCSVTTAAACTGTVIWRMSGASNAHAELPSQSTAAYNSNVVCCTNVTGLGNACTGTFATALKLFGVTNAHVQQTGSYAQSACISVPSGGSVSVGYQATNCTGFDTTLASMKATTNSHVGNTTAYTEYKICGTAAGAVPQTLTFSINDNSIGFGTLSTSAARFANGAGTGDTVEVEAHTLTASTNATNGYVITVNGNTLTSGSFTINAIGCTNTVSSAGTEQFGLRMTATGGNGAVQVPYAAADFAFCTTNFPDDVASDPDGDDVSTTYSVRYLGNITGTTEAGSYSAALTYVVTGNF